MHEQPQPTPIQQRLFYLSRYIHALENNDLAAAAQALEAASTDGVLEDLLLEVNALYQEDWQVDMQQPELESVYSQLEAVMNSIQNSERDAAQNSLTPFPESAALPAAMSNHKVTKTQPANKFFAGLPGRQTSPARSKVRRWYDRPLFSSFVAVLLVALLLSSFLVLFNSRQKGRTGVGSATGSQISGTWRNVPNPALPGEGNGLFGVAALAENDVWAVGKADTEALIEHWNGQHWTAVPNLHLTQTWLLHITALSSNDLWAVGQSNAQAFTLHWDGSSWKALPTPHPAGWNISILTSVAARSPNDIWAVGVAWKDQYTGHTLVEHWDGASWQVVASPDLPGSQISAFNAVAVLAPNDVWAVGEMRKVSPDTQTLMAQSLIEHWNGASWSVIAEPQTDGLTLSGIVALSPQNIWTVGERRTGALIEHWDGASWKVVPASTPAKETSTLMQIVAFSANDLWAVGLTALDAPRMLFEHWNGTSWQALSSPCPRQYCTVRDAGAVARSGKLWAVGYASNTFADGILGQPLTELYAK